MPRISVENAEGEEGIDCESCCDNMRSHAIPILGDKLNADDVKSICDLYEDRSLTTRDTAKELVKLEEYFTNHSLQKNQEQLSCGCNVLSMLEL